MTVFSDRKQTDSGFRLFANDNITIMQEKTTNVHKSKHWSTSVTMSFTINTAT